jgi:hypothetical protein
MEDLFLGSYIVARLHLRLVLVGCSPIKNLYMLHVVHIPVREGPLLHAWTAIKGEQLVGVERMKILSAITHFILKI